MEENKSEDLAPIEINLNRGTVDEGSLALMGFQIEAILKMMFGGSFIPTKIKGTRDQVSHFARALGNERRYLNAFEKHGLTDKRTLGNRHKLEKAISGFEKTTGIKWPFK
tara:strand:+ start:752 stop:1081 length:330 start_codon:yes stop_codon:yes gene_type:complete